MRCITWCSHLYVSLSPIGYITGPGVRVSGSQCKQWWPFCDSPTGCANSGGHFVTRHQDVLTVADIL
ncbi:hypothetical protein GDO81_022082 [Engystomops pustulosus]|uniref:Uncharacterized protein n=1 Tax=Engystomops pustulosus TaxID=76066 RepID=A0AAV6ZBD9_ENGPU|nr:hypothetical protein GDO81_022082 [Engystomops pustulosus]